MEISDQSRGQILKLLNEVALEKHIINHVQAVEQLSLQIAKLISGVDLSLVQSGALLHDIGRSVTHSIHHAIIGAKMLRMKGVSEDIVHIVQNHIGAGITATEAQSLGLPVQDYLPETLEAKIVAAADNLISGERRRPIRLLINHLAAKGAINAAKRVAALHEELSTLAGCDLDELS